MYQISHTHFIPYTTPKMHPENQLRDACCHLVNMIEDKSTSCVLRRKSLWAERCRPLPNYFGVCSLSLIQWDRKFVKASDDAEDFISAAWSIDASLTNHVLSK